MNLQPLGDRVVVKAMSEDEMKTASGKIFVLNVLKLQWNQVLVCEEVGAAWFQSSPLSLFLSCN